MNRGWFSNAYRIGACGRNARFRLCLLAGLVAVLSGSYERIVRSEADPFATVTPCRAPARLEQDICIVTQGDGEYLLLIGNVLASNAMIKGGDVLTEISTGKNMAMCCLSMIMSQNCEQGWMLLKACDNQS